MPQAQRRTYLWTLAGAAALVLLILWFLRPWFHGPVMFFYKHPLIWLPMVGVLVAGGFIATRLTSSQPTTRGRGLVAGGLLVASLFALIFFSVLEGALVQRSIYTNTTYEEIPGLPAGGTVRLVPREVAVEIASSGFNSPTETLTDFRSVKTPEGLAWSALRTPDGLVRVFTKKSQGVVTLDASSTERRVTAADAEFETAPGIQITDNLRWRLLKEHYLIDLTNPVPILDAEGEPAIIVPYIEYEGFLVRRPKLGGVFVVHPDGEIEDLSPEEAAERPEIRDSGRLFPEELAREFQDAFAYKEGIWNRFFIHEEQTQITDTEENRQPYLIDFGERGTKWVTVAEPYGRAFAANAIFLTDTVSGETQIWRVGEDESLSGNRRAIETVRSVSIPGIVFSDEEIQSEGGGRFKVVEPRPVFIGGRLVFLISIIPESANSVTKSVIVDAARNKVTAIFNHDTDPNADQALLTYLETGVLPGSAALTPTGTPEPVAPTPPAAPAPAPPAGGNAALERRLERLIQRQRKLLEDTEGLLESLRGP